ncbi:hypothetical protein JIR23_06645 [Bradyrhizobium diazoefficiens]|nr:hypothetical protein [Bradyrhizobium diazoefficiens]QQN67525.1 hypothetical protein JIR23_06645 [Bradyrhizobium diazoefficiens]
MIDLLSVREVPPALTPQVLEENGHWLLPHSLIANDVSNICFQTYAMGTPRHILVDSCLSNHKAQRRPNGA